MPRRNSHVVLILSLVVVVVGFLGWYFVLRPSSDSDLGGSSPVRRDDTTANAEPPPAATAAPGAITGKVLVYGTNEPGADIPIRITGGAKPITLVTEKDGSFVAKVPSEIALTLVVQSPDPWSPVTMPGLQVDPDGTEALGTIYLTVGFVVKGEVVDGRGAPVGGAEVRAYRHSTAEMQPNFLSILTELGKPREALDQAVSGPDGTFELTKLHPGPVRIEAEAKGFAIGAVNKAVVSPETEELVFRIVLSAGVRLAGTVKTAGEEPIAGAVVTALRAERALQRDLDFAPVQRRTDEKGRFEFTALAPGRLGLMVTAEGYPTRMVNRVDLEEPQTVDVVLGGSAAIEGKVTNADDEPIAGARVMVAAGREDGAFARTMTDEEGRYRIENLPPGRIMMFSIDADGYAPYPSGGGFPGTRGGGEGELKENETLTKDVKLESGATVDGHVLDSTTGRGVAGAQVRLVGGAGLFRGGGGKSAIADAEGHYEITGVAEGRYLMTVQAEGFYQPGMSASSFQGLFRPSTNANESEPADSPVLQIGPEDATKRKDLTVSPGARVSGVVLGPDGEPVAGAEISTAGADGRMNPFSRFLNLGPSSVLSNEKGEFVLDGVAASDSLRLTATAEGFVDGETDPIAVSSGGEITGVTIRLGEGATVTGTLRSADGGAPLAGEIRLVPQTDNGPGGIQWWQMGQTMPHPAGADGAFRAEGIAPGRYVLVAQAPGHLDLQRTDVLLTEGAEVDLGALTLEKGLTIEGIVTDDRGQPVSGARVFCTPHREANQPGVRPTPGFGRPGSGTTDADGKFRIDKLTPGSYDLSARADGFAAASLDSVNAGAAQVRITMMPGLSIEGRVLFPSGKPAEGVFVNAQGENQNRQGARTDAEGHFEITDLPVGVYRVTVSGGGFGFGPNGPTDREGFRDTSVDGVSAGTRDLLIRLETGLSIRGVVVDEQGSPVANAFVFGSGPENSRSFARTDEHGAFDMSGLAPGKIQLRASVQSENGLQMFGNVEDVDAGATNVRVVVKERPRMPREPNGPR